MPAHASTYLALAERAAPHLSGPEQAQWLARLDREHDNLRAAIAYFLDDAACVDQALRLGAELMRFWYIRGDYREGVETLEAASTSPRLWNPLSCGPSPSGGRLYASAVR